MECLANIQFSKDLGLGHTVQGFIKERQRVAVLSSEIIQFPEVNTKAECSIVLLDKEDRGRKRGLTRLDESFAQIVGEVQTNNLLTPGG